MYIDRGFGIFGSGSPLASVWLLRNLGRLQLFAYYYDFFFSFNFGWVPKMENLPRLRRDWGQ